MSPLIYPGATHKRFEHSLGVMELAGRVFDVITRDDKIHDEVRKSIPEITNSSHKSYWRNVLRMAALCHDLGHLPFSHAAEKELLPDEFSHEDLTIALVRSPEMETIWKEMTPPIRVEDIVKLSVGPKKLQNQDFDNWTSILSEIIVGNSFGVDRIDYLLRDSYHTGVSYGKFDHHRLIDTLRILPQSYQDNGAVGEPKLGIEHGGLQSAEAMALARYFMYSQVYFHSVRRIYDIHLKDFLLDWLPNGSYSTDIEDHLRLTDNEVWSGISEAARSKSSNGHVHAKRIIERNHFKVVYERNPRDVKIDRDTPNNLYISLVDRFGSDWVRVDSYSPSSIFVDFPVLLNDGRVESSFNLSDTLRAIPSARFQYIYVDGSMELEATKFVRKTLNHLANPLFGA